jgi:hypothetical protein
MRTLSPAWDEGAVDSDSATWLIDQVYAGESYDAVLHQVSARSGKPTALTGTCPEGDRPPGSA